MIDIVKGFIQRLIPKNIAGIIGVAQKVVPLARELIVVALRIVAIFIPAFEGLIEKVGDFFDRVDEVIETLKNWFLGEE